MTGRIVSVFYIIVLTPNKSQQRNYSNRVLPSGHCADSSPQNKKIQIHIVHTHWDSFICSCALSIATGNWLTVVSNVHFGLRSFPWWRARVVNTTHLLIHMCVCTYPATLSTPLSWIKDVRRQIHVAKTRQSAPQSNCFRCTSGMWRSIRRFKKLCEQRVTAILETSGCMHGYGFSSGH